MRVVTFHMCSPFDQKVTLLGTYPIEILKCTKVSKQLAVESTVSFLLFVEKQFQSLEKIWRSMAHYLPVGNFLGVALGGKVGVFYFYSMHFCI